MGTYTNHTNERRDSAPLIDQFLTLHAAPDLLATRWYGRHPAKEISESMAAFVAVRESFGVKTFGDPNVLAVVIGDGVDPRTGALFAMVTRWTVVSIDPLLRADTSRVKRLVGARCKVEDYVPPDSMKSKRVVFVLVHSHGVLTREIVAKFAPLSFAVVSLPCCTEDVDLGMEPDLMYDELGCMSPARTVRIWGERPWGVPATEGPLPVTNDTFVRLIEYLTVKERQLTESLLIPDSELQTHMSGSVANMGCKDG